ncbi:cysteine proteinase inhibitor 1 [Humulus lupulus]|uniref:cysteine proteinase inhibitor 1 n=1 Tax=Humulus lupulus TaxID=3486 RepID=UPI002B41702F|nr:cysteine proteinase inhibitor 1 [Humulus lupulus]
MPSYTLFFLLGLLLPLVASAARHATGPLTGGWQPIENLKDPQVRQIAEYAVAEYNKQTKTDLKLSSVVKGESQVVAGTNYKLVLSVKNGPVTKYEAIVWDKPWQHFRNLTSFKPV